MKKILNSDVYASYKSYIHEMEELRQPILDYKIASYFQDSSRFGEVELIDMSKSNLFLAKKEEKEL